MSRETKRKLRWFGIGGGGFSCFALLITVGSHLSGLNIPTREITLVARDMAFYLERDPRPNPPLTFAPGERIQLNLINQDAGMLHDVVIADLGLASAKLEYGERDSVGFRVRAGADTEYLCSLHPVAMRGSVLILRQAKNSNP